MKFFRFFENRKKYSNDNKIQNGENVRPKQDSCDGKNRIKFSMKQHIKLFI